jgi:hypothetical protein
MVAAGCNEGLVFSSCHREERAAVSQQSAVSCSEGSIYISQYREERAVGGSQYRECLVIVLEKGEVRLAIKFGGRL